MAKGRVESKAMEPPTDLPKGHKLYQLRDEYLGGIKPEYPAGVDMSQLPEAVNILAEEDRAESDRAGLVSFLTKGTSKVLIQ